MTRESELKQRLIEALYRAALPDSGPIADAIEDFVRALLAEPERAPADPAKNWPVARAPLPRQALKEYRASVLSLRVRFKEIDPQLSMMSSDMLAIIDTALAYSPPEDPP